MVNKAETQKTIQNRPVPDVDHASNEAHETDVDHLIREKEEEVITRRSMLDEAAKTAKDDGNQAKSDKNVNWLNIIELHESPFRT